MLGQVTKNSVDQLDYDLDFGRWLDPDDTITNADVTITPSGTMTCPQVQISEADVKVWLAGGVNGTTYQVEVTTTTQAGRIKVETFKARVKDDA